MKFRIIHLFHKHFLMLCNNASVHIENLTDCFLCQPGTGTIYRAGAADQDKTKTRKTLLAEKKDTPFYQLPKLHDLSQRIAELTEGLKELKSEKASLLNTLDCADDVGISEVKKQIATLETALKNLEEQESKYAAELEDALKQYTDLLNEEAEARPVREFLRLKQQQQAQQKPNIKESRDSWER